MWYVFVCVEGSTGVGRGEELLPGMVAHNQKPNRFQASLGCTSGPWLKVMAEMKRYRLA